MFAEDTDLHQHAVEGLTTSDLKIATLGLVVICTA